MAKDIGIGSKITFAGIRELASKERWDKEWIDHLDRFLGVSLLLAGVVTGPIGKLALDLLQPKLELINIARAAARRFVAGKPDDFLGRHRRLTAAHSLLELSVFFEAVEIELPQLAKAVALTDEERHRLVGKSVPNEAYEAVAMFAHSHPAMDPAEERFRRVAHYRSMVSFYLGFIKGLSVWESKSSSQRAAITEGLDKVPSVAAELFEAQYLELLIEVPAFAKWAEVYEFTRLRSLTAELSAETLERLNKLAESAKSVDVGLHNLRTLIEASGVAQDRSPQARKVAQGLARAYEARIAEPVIVDTFRDDELTVTYPRRCEIFVPQAFQTLRYIDPSARLELEVTWEPLAVHQDLGHFIVAYLESTFSTETPLLVLGHPGSGKSLLSEMLAATLGEQFHPVRIELRNADAEADFQDQIEHAIRRVTGHDVNWASYAEEMADSPPVIILDGFDELLQASGKTYSNYLNRVQGFQRREAVQGRPVRVMVTSRLTLIDKAAIPLGSTILRLLDFDRSRQEKWTAIWNEANHGYFRARNLEPFALPGEPRIIQLAAQPLLLLMLAVYDSAGNGLRDGQLDRTSLYYSLLTRFITRERVKGDGAETFAALSAEQRTQQIEQDLERLGVAAIGMFNRRALYIHRDQLNRDIAHFQAAQRIEVGHGQPLTQADLLLGSFFFIHESKSWSGSGQESSPTAFEFLHNTFGEFLSADFLLRRVLSQTSVLRKLSGDKQFESLLAKQLAEPPADWYSCTIYTSLHTRPVVLSMMREWLPHRLSAAGRASAEFEADLAALAIRQLDLVLNGDVSPVQRAADTAFDNLPALGHAAVYSLNMVLLWTHLTREPVTLDESVLASDHADCRPWDRLTQLWRSWFALESLGPLPNSLNAVRDAATIRLSLPYIVGETKDRLALASFVASGLADDIGYGTAMTSHLLAGTVALPALQGAAQKLANEGISIAPIMNWRLAQLGELSAIPFGGPQIGVGHPPSLTAESIAMMEVLLRTGSVELTAFLGRHVSDVGAKVMKLPRYEAALLVAQANRAVPRFVAESLSGLTDTLSVGELLNKPAAEPMLRALIGFEPQGNLLRLIEEGWSAGCTLDLQTDLAVYALAVSGDFRGLRALAWAAIKDRVLRQEGIRDLTEAQFLEVGEATLVETASPGVLRDIAGHLYEAVEESAHAVGTWLMTRRLVVRASPGEPLRSMLQDHTYFYSLQWVSRTDLVQVLRLCRELDPEIVMREAFGESLAVAVDQLTARFGRVPQASITAQEASDLEFLTSMVRT